MKNMSRLRWRMSRQVFLTMLWNQVENGPFPGAKVEGFRNVFVKDSDTASSASASFFKMRLAKDRMSGS